MTENPEQLTVLLTCGAATGGSPGSTVALGQAGSAAGERVVVLIAADDPYSVRDRATAAAAKLNTMLPAATRPIWHMHDRWQRRGGTRPGVGMSATSAGPFVQRAADVPAAARDHAADVIVASSHRRLDLMRLLDEAERRAIPFVWYVREQTALAHARLVNDRAALVITNSAPLSDELAVVTGGSPPQVIPSPVDTSELPVDQRGTELAGGHVLLVNPVQSHGVATLAQVATLRPDLRFVLQESWDLEGDDQTAVEAATRLPNVIFRRRVGPGDLFGDARALLLIHEGPELRAARPRVAIEAAWAGVPSLALANPGLDGLVPPSTTMLPQGAPPAMWAEALDAVLRDRAALSTDAARWAQDAIVTPAAAWQQLRAALWPLL